MVAIIKTGHSIRGMLNYNENKVKDGAAKIIGQHNYPLDAERLTYQMKLTRLERQALLNENVKRHTVHISLNFDPSETNLPKEKLLEIAEMYMDKIGFKEQPCLIYQHHDAGHPHLHIATINVQANGKRIAMQNIGRDKSEPVRKEIEQTFNLVKAEGQKKKEYKPEPSKGRVDYGKTETKKAIENALNFVVDNYRYASLPELNAVLKLYNIIADKGTENSRVAKHNGLLFHALDAQGNPIGVPIKASSFYNKPTIKNLEKKFAINEVQRTQSKGKIKMAIDLAFARNNIIMLPQLMKLLKSQGIDMLLRQNAGNIVYGITYVDHTSKSVFNGSAIGKEYSAKGLQDKCNLNREKLTHEEQKFLSKESLFNLLNDHKDLMSISDMTNFLDVLMRVENNYEYIAQDYKRRRKKRRRGI
ncbi:relaxase [Flavobacterium rivuli WB 3.3-2 = DSM 21788]|uniref:Relaxase n=1 Tax=Flavobacterium rivuli WB 3.3-2 = DSM 21788 TaxID=1121895 RepID=A0A0A2M3D3_9FLAO|nr:relaxase/mobilization nuclease domain-containing protein [Flavobacterium rivuli]KGO85983.1 relaxase [Flavobacterium rivuli WB 3.3-2 = DSM 21788]